MSRPAVVLQGVSKRYLRGGPLVLRAVDLTAPAGALVRIHGENGSGKSTLLRILAGVAAPTGGRVLGRPARVGYVPERFPAGLRFTPREYLRHLSRVRGLRGADRGVEALRLLGGDDLLDVPMATLSKGMCQKVAIAQSVLDDPSLLVLDEAFTGLDRDARDVLVTELGRRRDAGAAVVLIDHGRLDVAADVDLRLADGVLGDGAGGPMMVVVLSGVLDGFDPACWPGVHHVAAGPDGLVVRVTAEACDGLLTAALGGGLSVRSVGPAR